MHSLASARKGYEKTALAGLDLARCEELWKRLHSYTASNKALPQLELDCSTLLPQLTRRLPAATDPGIRDGELLVALVDLGIVQPHQDARRKAEGRTIALVTGRIAAPSQALSMRLALLLGVGHDEATTIALREATDAACLAAAALWIHGELGSDAELSGQLEARCSGRSPQAWIEAALARPRSALHGLALGRLGGGPARLVPLDRYWWAPVGSLDLLADPQQLNVPVEPGVSHLKVETLTPPQPSAPNDEPQ